MFKATFILGNGHLFWTRKRKQNVQGVKPRTSTSTLLHLNAFQRSFDLLGVNICVCACWEGRGVNEDNSLW